MHREQIKAMALANGFKLKQQPDGSEDLNPYVYEFADALVEPLQAELERLQHLLLEKFKEWQIDSGEWDEVEWLERVQVTLFGKEQPEEQAKEVQS